VPGSWIPPHASSHCRVQLGRGQSRALATRTLGQSTAAGPSPGPGRLSKANLSRDSMPACIDSMPACQQQHASSITATHRPVCQVTGHVALQPRTALACLLSSLQPSTRVQAASRPATSYPHAATLVHPHAGARARPGTGHDGSRTVRARNPSSATWCRVWALAGRNRIHSVHSVGLPPPGVLDAQSLHKAGPLLGASISNG
jgi:hypothetical protein